MVGLAQLGYGGRKSHGDGYNIVAGQVIAHLQPLTLTHAPSYLGPLHLEFGVDCAMNVVQTLRLRT